MIDKNYRGLTSEEVERSRAGHGWNLITPPRDDSAWRLLWEKFRDPIIRILLVAALLSLAVAFVDGNFTETLGIIAAIILATCVGFAFEWDAMRRFRRLNRVNDDLPVKVRRDGEVRTVPRREVVVGDLVLVESGETVAADGTLIEALALRVNESSLTGETETGKTADPAHFDAEATYPSNRLLRGTTVVDGYGSIVVTEVGDKTEAGRVTEQSAVDSGEPTPLNRQLTRLSHWIGKIGFVLSGAIFVVVIVKQLWLDGGWQGDWVDIARIVLNGFMVSVAMIVMAVPEGLPMSITLSLAMSMRRMLKTNNLVRRMHACETMGAVTVICTDKTGTLTENRMRVQEMVRCREAKNRLLYEQIALNTTAFLDREGQTIGNPTEGALLDWMHGRGADYEALRQNIRIVDRLTFTTERKYMATLIESPEAGRLLCVKGAPEIVRAMCSGASDTEGEDEFSARLIGFQQRAMRTLALASKPTEAQTCTEAIAAGGLQLEAIAAISDPVREEVPAAVERCRRAGIDVKIVTGDTVATALEIARRIGLWSDADSPERNSITGAEFAAASDEELLPRVQELKVISRARPLDKQRLVRLLQQRGEVVAVTGDGTNDAPALNFADVGLAMGSGTSVAKDAGDITLLDDSFSSIATAVMWGRSLYRNIQRFVLFQLTINFAAIVVELAGALFCTELPLTVVQILWVNLIMDTFAAMALASLPPDPEVMYDRPRGRDAFIVTPAMGRTILVCGLVFVTVLLGMLLRWQWLGGAWSLEHLTIFFTTFVFLQFWNLFNARGFETRHSVFRRPECSKMFYMVLLLIGLGQWFIVEVGGEVFRTVPLSAVRWAEIVCLTSVIALGGDFIRSIRRAK